MHSVRPPRKLSGWERRTDRYLGQMNGKRLGQVSTFWVRLVIGAHPTLFSPMEGIIASVGVFRTRRAIPELHSTLLRCLEVERVHLFSIDLFPFPIGLLQAYQVGQMRISMSMVPNRNRILFGRGSRVVLTASDLPDDRAACDGKDDRTKKPFHRGGVPFSR